MLIAVASLECIGMPQQLTISPTDNHSPDVPTNTEKRMNQRPGSGGHGRDRDNDPGEVAF